MSNCKVADVLKDCGTLRNVGIYSGTWQNTWIFSNTVTRNSNLAREIQAFHDDRFQGL